MSYAEDETRILRQRLQNLESQVWGSERERVDPETSIVLVTVDNGAYPDTAAAYYACKVVTITGAEVEGGGPGFEESEQIVLAANCGNGVPVEGTHVIGVLVDGHIAFRFDGAGA